MEIKSKILEWLAPLFKLWQSWDWLGRATVIGAVVGILGFIVGSIALAFYLGDRHRNTKSNSSDQRAIALLSQQITEVSKKLGVTEHTIIAFMQKVGIEKMPPEKWTETLENVAKDYKRFKKEASLLDPNDPETKKLIHKAVRLADKGDLDQAQKNLEEASKKELVAARSLAAKANERLSNAAKTIALEANLLRIAGQYAKAAKLFINAANLVEASDPKAWLGYHEDAAKAFFDQGVASGDKQALTNSITQLTKLAREYDRRGDRQKWANNQINMGNVLGVLGHYEHSRELLNEAVKAFTASLQVFSRKRNPYAWSTIQHNLSNLLLFLGAQQKSKEKLEQAVQACRSALLERTRQKDPLRWAATQSNMGVALLALGKMEENTERIQQAEAAFRAALEVYSRERAPYEWAIAQNNLGNALMALGEREEGTEHLQQAAAAYHSALEELRSSGPAYQVKAFEENLARAERLLAERKKLASKPAN